jgi:LmbE family N-acetylglucosaminyl deacetylase
MNSQQPTILAAFAHPDDEVLGCGGTIARHVDDGDEVSLIFMADGVGARDENISQSIVIRNEARDKALKILGVSEFYSLDFPDNKMDSIPLLEVVKGLELIIEKLKPHRIYTHHYGDLNVDHRITHQAVMTACRPQPGICAKEILTFEVMSSTEWGLKSNNQFSPNVFVEITEYLDKKLDALSAYEVEMRPYPHSRSIQHLEFLAKHRGNCVGVESAEAFEGVRFLW